MRDGMWIRVKDRLPARGALVLGWDVFYDSLHLCAYDGARCDNGDPRLHDRGGDNSGDYSIEYWMPLPDGPNVAEKEDLDDGPEFSDAADEAAAETLPVRDGDGSGSVRG